MSYSYPMLVNSGDRRTQMSQSVMFAFLYLKKILRSRWVRTTVFEIQQVRSDILKLFLAWSDSSSVIQCLILHSDLKQNPVDAYGSLISVGTAISDSSLYGKILWYSGSINVNTCIFQICTFQSSSVPKFAGKGDCSENLSFCTCSYKKTIGSYSLQ